MVLALTGNLRHSLAMAAAAGGAGGAGGGGGQQPLPQGPPDLGHQAQPAPLHLLQYRMGATAANNPAVLAGGRPPGVGNAELLHDLILDGPEGRGAGGGLGSGLSLGSGGGSLIGGRSQSPARLAYTSEKHPRATFSELNLIRKQHNLCDVVINVGGRKIYAHK